MIESGILSNELIRKFERTACEEEGTNCGDTKISEAPLGLPPRSRHHRGWTDRIALAPLPFFFFFSSSRFQSSIESWFFRHRVNAFDLSKKRSWDKNYEKIMEATLRWRKNFLPSISISLSLFFFLSFDAFRSFTRRTLNYTSRNNSRIRRIRQVFVFDVENRENGSSTPMIMG